MKTAFIYAKDGNLYALHVENTIKAKTFNELYNNESKKAELRQVYRDAELKQYALYTFGFDFSENELILYAMSYVLEKYNSGIRLLKKEEGFKQKNMKINADDVVIRTTCK